jgi:hypothetical protein
VRRARRFRAQRAVAALLHALLTCTRKNAPYCACAGMLARRHSAHNALRRFRATFLARASLSSRRYRAAGDRVLLPFSPGCRGGDEHALKQLIDQLPRHGVA